MKIRQIKFIGLCSFFVCATLLSVTGCATAKKQKKLIQEVEIAVRYNIAQKVDKKLVELMERFQEEQSFTVEELRAIIRNEIMK